MRIQFDQQLNDFIRFIYKLQINSTGNANESTWLPLSECLNCILTMETLIVNKVLKVLTSCYT